MKVIIRIILLVALNIFSFAFIHILGALIGFMALGFDAATKGSYPRLFLPFTCLQIGINIWLYVKRRLHLTLYSLLINIAVVVALYLYYIVYATSLNYASY